MAGRGASIAARMVACVIAAAFAAAVCIVSVVPNIRALDFSRLQDKPVAINEANFPDPVLMHYVHDNYDTDGNWYLSPEEAATVETIGTYDTSTYVVPADDRGLSSMGLTSLAGLEYFPNLTMVVAEDNAITFVDLTEMDSLRYLDLRDNTAASFDYDSSNAGLQIVVNEGASFSDPNGLLDIVTVG